MHTIRQQQQQQQPRKEDTTARMIVKILDVDDESAPSDSGGSSFEMSAKYC